MSTYWDVHCPTHRESPDMDGWNHGDEELALIWRNRDQLLALDPGVFDVYTLETQNCRKLGALIGWLHTHGECPGIQLVNEYGDRKSIESMEPLPPKHCVSCTCPPR